jgi:DNA/RNA endonuclease G (NUC1)
MRLHPARSALGLLVAFGLLSCTDTPLAVKQSLVSPGGPRHDATNGLPSVIISQVYGGGGNSGATLTNDFVELFNPGSDAVNLAGWSVQYASSTGTTWQVTNLAGTIQPGAYYLVQESKGSAGTTALPAPDASGSIAMAAGAGKVWLSSSVTALTGTCPAGALVIDQVSFGTAATDCGFKTTPTIDNTTAAVRGQNGCSFTGDLSVDFTKTTPIPRNSATTPIPACQGGGIQPVGPLDHVLMGGATSVSIGATTQLSATPQDASNKTVGTATVTWTSSDPTVASVDGTGKVTGVVASPNAVTITATAVDNGITKTGTLQVTVSIASIKWIDISSSSASFPPGFQTQLFATARVAQGGTIINANFTFEAVDPTIATVATVANSGLVTGVAAPADGTTKPGFRIIATPVDGLSPPDTFVTHPITIEAPAPAPTSIYAKNDEFGDPTAATAANPNDLLIVRPEYTISYNESRGTPNWVSYELDARQMIAGQDRCNCFTGDPMLPAAKQIFTSDYTNGGFDRGHMTRSADRTAGNVDNASTFYLTNVVPQMADLNQGVWAQFENALADSASKGGRAVYIITGPLFSKSNSLTFLKNEGKVAIPDSTWKVAFIGPRNGGVPFTVANLQSWGDIAGTTLLAVSMPNIAGVRNDPWQKYLTTVDKIEAATGYNFLSLLPTAFQTAIEAGDHAPTAAFALTGTPSEGTALAFDASASGDPDLGRTDLDRTEALTYAWHFSDGADATGKTVSHTFANNGTFTAALTVTDAFGWQSVLAETLTVANVVPAVKFSAITPLTIQSGDPIAVSGSFTDPGPDSPWHASIAWGNGNNSQPLPATFNKSGSKMLSASQYFAPGTYSAVLSVTDKDGGVGADTLAVTVSSRTVHADGVKTSATSPGTVSITVYSDLLAHMSDLDLASVRIGSVGLALKSNGRPDATLELLGIRDKLGFSIKALTDAGLLSGETTSLDLVANLTNGIQIIAHVPVTMNR